LAGSTSRGGGASARGLERWLGVEIRHLTALRAVAEERSFRRAARRLNYAQSSVSEQVAQLERVVGATLVDRRRARDGVRLTAAGEAMLAHVDAIIARLRAAEADIAGIARGAAGVVRLGLPQSAAAPVFPRLLARLTREAPALAVQPAESLDDGPLLSSLAAGDLDLSLAVLPLPDGDFGARALFSDPYVVVVPRAVHGAVGDEALDLAGAPLPLIRLEGCRSFRLLEDELRRAGVEPTVVHASRDRSTALSLVEQGIGYALVPRLALPPLPDGVAAAPFRPRVGPRTVVIAWRPDRPLSPAASAVRELISAVAADVAEPAPAAG
jgi:DNA-binding transcriptional LysR family regulator